MFKLVSPLIVSLTAATALAQVPCYDSNLGTALTLSDDSFSAPLPLGFTFNYGGVGYTEVQVCSNGFVVFGSGPPGVADFSPTVAELIGNPQARICPMWRDLNPSISGSGQVWYNAVPASASNPAYFSVTYDNVYQYATTTPLGCQLILIDGGSIQIHHRNSAQSGTNAWVLGASPGNGATANPVAFSALPTPVITSVDTLHENGTAGFALAGTTQTWNPLSPGYVVTLASGCASQSSYGVGCVRQYNSFYEMFAAGTHDLGNTAFTVLYTGSGMVVIPSTTPLRPIGSATALTLTDDSEVTVPFAVGTTSMPASGGAATALTICSNGFVSTATGNGTAFTPVVANFLNAPATTWRMWHDCNPAIAGSGQVYVEETATHFYVMFDGVWSYGTTAGPGNEFQWHFDKTTGSCEMVIGTVDNTGNGHLVGYSSGGPSNDPGNSDLSALTLITTGDPEISELRLTVSANPVVSSTISLVTSNITPTAQVGGVLYGLTRFNQGISLAPFGMNGCFQYNDMLAVSLFFPATATSVSVPFTVPNAPGVAVQVQTAIYDPQSVTGLGLSSNGLELMIGN